MKFLTATKWK